MRSKILLSLGIVLLLWMTVVPITFGDTQCRRVEGKVKLVPDRHCRILELAGYPNTPLLLAEVIAPVPDPTFCSKVKISGDLQGCGYAGLTLPFPTPVDTAGTLSFSARSVLDLGSNAKCNPSQPFQADVITTDKGLIQPDRNNSSLNNYSQEELKISGGGAGLTGTLYIKEGRIFAGGSRYVGYVGADCSPPDDR